MIYVIGLGPGNINYLTEEAKHIIESSEILIGGRRNLESITFFDGEKVELGSNLKEVVQYIRLHGKTKKMSLVASGDPMIYGLGKYILNQFQEEEVCIISGISSIQYMFSQIPLDMNDVYITSSHGRMPDFDKILNLEKVAMVTDEKIGPSEIAEEIIKRGLKKVMWIGENLSYPEERITRCLPSEVIRKKYKMNVVVIKDEE